MIAKGKEQGSDDVARLRRASHDNQSFIIERKIVDGVEAEGLGIGLLKDDCRHHSRCGHDAFLGVSLNNPTLRELLEIVVTGW